MELKNDSVDKYSEQERREKRLMAYKDMITSATHERNNAASAQLQSPSIQVSEEVFDYFNVTNPFLKNALRENSFFPTHSSNEHFVGLKYFNDNFLATKIFPGQTLELAHGNKKIRFHMHIDPDMITIPFEDYAFSDLDEADFSPSMRFVFSVVCESLRNIITAKYFANEDFRQVSLTELTQYIARREYGSATADKNEKIRTAKIRQQIHLAMLYLDNSRIFFSHAGDEQNYVVADRFISVSFTSVSNSNPEHGIKGESEVYYTIKGYTSWLHADITEHLLLHSDFSTTAQIECIANKVELKMIEVWKEIDRLFASSLISDSPAVTIEDSDRGPVSCKIAFIEFDKLYNILGLSDECTVARKPKRKLRDAILDHLSLLKEKGVVLKYDEKKIGKAFIGYTVYINTKYIVR